MPSSGEDLALSNKLFKEVDAGYRNSCITAIDVKPALTRNEKQK